MIERKDGVVTVTMNRPERKNAANGKMLRELRATFEEVEDRSDDRVMVLTGAGGAFCSGADLSDPDGPATDPTRSGLARMRRLGDVACQSRPSPRSTAWRSEPASPSPSAATSSCAATAPGSP